MFRFTVAGDREEEEGSREGDDDVVAVAEPEENPTDAWISPRTLTTERRSRTITDVRVSVEGEVDVYEIESALMLSD